MAADGRGLARSSIASAAAGLLQGANFLVLVVLSRRLPPADFGAYRLVTILQALPALLLALGTPEAMLYALGRAPDPRARGRAFAVGLAWMAAVMPPAGAACGVLALLAARLLHSATLANSAWAVACLGALNTWLLFAPALFVGQGRPGWYLLLAAVQLVTGTALAAVLTSGYRAGLPGALWAAVLTAALGAALTLMAFAPVARPGPLAAFWRRDLLPALRYGYPVAVGGGLYAAGYQMDHLVASLLFSPAGYGLYAAGAWQLPVGLLAQ